MAGKLSITVMAGGPSAEREVSLRSGAGVARALRSLGHAVSELDPLGPGWQLPAGTELVFLALHGTYGEDWRYPNRVLALSEVGTDPALARAGYSDQDRFRAWFAQSYYGERSQITPALGYLAPPLDGVWASAPYLHNDAVPTLAALLEPAARPTWWRPRRTADGQPVYDRDALGWAYESLAAGKSAAMSWDERNRIYDTTGKGYGNGGHRFGDRLSAADRRALIEYLKTL